MNETDLLQIDMVVSREFLEKRIDLLPLSACVACSLILNSYFWIGVTSFEI